MKYWDRALKDLKNSDRKMKDVFDVVCSFADNVFFERLSGSSIETVTYREFAERVRLFAPALRSRLAGFQKGSFVGIDMENSAEWVISFWGILMAGFKPLLINGRLDKSINREIVESTGAVAVIVKDGEDGLRYGDLMEETSSLGASGTGSCEWEDAFALTTSGTSGTPKVFLYNGNALSNQIFNSKYVLKQNKTIKNGYKGKIKIMAFLPFYHIFGLVATLMWFSFFGRTFVFVNDMRPETIQYACKRHNVTHFFAIPIVWNGVAAHIRRQAKTEGEEIEKKLEKGLNLSIKLQSLFPSLGERIARNLMFKKVRERVFGNSLFFCISGGGYIKEDTLKVINGLGYCLYNGYGMTEIGIASVELRRRAQDRLEGSVGMPFPSISYRFNGEGILEVCGGSVFSARMQDGVTEERAEDEWYCTNDILFAGKDGHYYINGRKDDLIVLANGEKIMPDIIEKNFELAYAKTYTVVGLKNGDKVEILLVIYPDPKATRAQVDEMLLKVYEVNGRLKPYEKLSRVLIALEPLPAVMELKVQRAAVKKMIADGSLRHMVVDLAHYSNAQAVTGGNSKEILEGVIEVFGEVLKSREVKGNSNFLLDLEGSSLEYFALLEALSKRFNVTFDLAKGYLITPIEFMTYIVKNS